MEGHIYVSRTLTPKAMKLLDNLDYEVRVGGDEPPSREKLLEDVAGAAGAIVMLSEKIDEEFFDAAGPGLEVVANLAVGYDNIDLHEAKHRAVIVTNTPGVLTEATADLTFALLLATTRRVVESDYYARSGKPWIWGPNEYVGLDISAGATLGIYGLGRIGLAVARRAQAFGMRTIGYARHLVPGQELDGVHIVEPDELLQYSDVLTLHTPLTDETRHLIDAAAIAKMKKGAYIINAGRGGLIDELAMVDALKSGQLAGAGLDVFEGEPVIRPELRELPNVVVTPHIGSAGDKTREVMSKLCIDNVVSVLDGKAPLTQVPYP
ncbi:MAG: D-glycerate dehydrogenase [Propionibacteriaceae bacterium]|jgi:lactate dehydrogenase-like 2-hydroxyacid dehydrogenase|nr:D-glycerate dehydrogenase [Propionibacteriaceae bacterium]